MRLSPLGGGPAEDCGGGPTELSEVGRSFGPEMVIIVISSIRPGLMLLRPMPPLNMMPWLCSLAAAARSLAAAARSLARARSETCREREREFAVREPTSLRARARGSREREPGSLANTALGSGKSNWLFKEGGNKRFADHLPRRVLGQVLGPSGQHYNLG